MVFKFSRNIFIIFMSIFKTIKYDKEFALYLFWNMYEFYISGENKEEIKRSHFSLLIDKNNVRHCDIHEPA